MARQADSHFCSPAVVLQFGSLQGVLQGALRCLLGRLGHFRLFSAASSGGLQRVKPPGSMDEGASSRPRILHLDKSLAVRMAIVCDSSVAVRRATCHPQLHGRCRIPGRQPALAKTLDRAGSGRTWLSSRFPDSRCQWRELRWTLPWAARLMQDSPRASACA